jgi:hypothetical protein
MATLSGRSLAERSRVWDREIIAIFLGLGVGKRAYILSAGRSWREWQDIPISIE